MKSLEGVTDEILVVDSYSSDQTRAICENHGVRFLEHKFDGHIQQKNYAMEQAEHDWVLSLDADESLTSELRDSILTVDLDKNDGFRLKRLTNFCGKWIKHSGWYPDKKIRLWNRTKGSWGGTNPHDRVEMDEAAKVGDLHGDLLHYSFYNLSDYILQIHKFSSLAAQAAFEKGKKSNFLIHEFFGPFWAFVKKYFVQAGFLDGYFGFIIAISTGYYRFLKYTKLRELHKNG